MSKTRKRSKKTSSLDNSRCDLLSATDLSSKAEKLSSSFSSIDAAANLTNSFSRKGKSSIRVPRLYLDIMKPNEIFLHVTVKAARNLYDEHSNGVDSYVRIHIPESPPESDWVTYTRINKSDPMFNETCTIRHEDTIGRSSLHISVWRVVKSHHYCLGCMAFPFSTINVTNKRLLGWFELLDTTLGQTTYRAFILLDCMVSKTSEVGCVAEMQLTETAETLEFNRRRAVFDLVNFIRRYLISIVNKYKIYCKSLQGHISEKRYFTLFNDLELVIKTQLNMFDYVKHCYSGRYAIGSVLRSWIPELACLIGYQRNKYLAVKMIQDMQHSQSPDVLDIIKDKSEEYRMLLGMPLLHMKQLTKYIRNVQHFTLDKHPDFTNIDWVQQYLYWLVVQVESPQRISHNQTLNHSTKSIDRSFTFSMPADYNYSEEDLEGYMRPDLDISSPQTRIQQKGRQKGRQRDRKLGILPESEPNRPLNLQSDESDFVEYDLGEISSLPDSPEFSEIPSDSEFAKESGEEKRASEPNEAGVATDLLIEDENEFEWPVLPPEDLEIDDEFLLTNQRTASLAKTLDHVIEVFSSVSKKKSIPSSPLNDKSNWKTIQKLVLPEDHVDNLKKEEEEEVCCEDIEEDGEDDGILHISTDQSQPSYYRTLSFDEQNKNHESTVNGDREETISLDTSPKSASNNVSFNFPTSNDPSPLAPRRASSLSHIEDTTPKTTQRCHSKHPIKSSDSPATNHSLTATPVTLRHQCKSEVMPRSVDTTPDLSIRRIFAVKSLNDILFSKEEYDMASV